MNNTILINNTIMKSIIFVQSIDLTLIINGKISMLSRWEKKNGFHSNLFFKHGYLSPH